MRFKIYWFYLRFYWQHLYFLSRKIKFIVTAKVLDIKIKFMCWRIERIIKAKSYE